MAGDQVLSLDGVAVTGEQSWVAALSHGRQWCRRVIIVSRSRPHAAAAGAAATAPDQGGHLGDAESARAALLIQRTTAAF